MTSLQKVEEWFLALLHLKQPMYLVTKMKALMEKNNPSTICKTQQTNARFRCAEISSPNSHFIEILYCACSAINDIITNLVTRTRDMN